MINLNDAKNLQDHRDPMSALRQALKGKKLNKHLSKTKIDASKLMISNKTANFFNSRLSRQ